MPETIKEKKSESSALYNGVKNSKPLFGSNAEALQALKLELERLAARHDFGVEELLQQANTTSNSQTYHLEALHLQRQIAHFKSRS